MRRIALNVHVGVVDESKTEKSDAINTVKVPFEIDEVQLKGTLRDMGFISANRQEYCDTKVFLIRDENIKIQICINECRTLDELGMKDYDNIVVIPSSSDKKILEERHQFYNNGRYINSVGAMILL